MVYLGVSLALVARLGDVEFPCERCNGDALDKFAAFIRDTFTVLKETEHVFDGGGVTKVFILAESHVVINTWPEHGLAFIDLFTCEASFEGRAMQFVKDLASATGWGIDILSMGVRYA